MKVIHEHSFLYIQAFQGQLASVRFHWGEKVGSRYSL